MLKLEHITIQNKEQTLVSDISFTIPSKEIHVLLGPNGAGKSTLLYGLFGHPDYTTTGKLSLDGEDVLTLPTHKKARAGLFLSLQYLPKIEGVTLGNFLYQAYGDMKGGGMSVLEFYKHAEALAKKYDIDPSFLKKGLNADLSGGEKKQTEALQMALLEPKFAVLDEIDSGVDVDSLKKITAVIADLKEKGTGFLIITHYKTLLGNLPVDAVHVMKDGKLIKSGDHSFAEEIFKNGYEGL